VASRRAREHAAVAIGQGDDALDLPLHAIEHGEELLQLLIYECMAGVVLLLRSVITGGADELAELGTSDGLGDLGEEPDHVLTEIVAGMAQERAQATKGLLSFARGEQSARFAKGVGIGHAREHILLFTKNAAGAKGVGS
jgi:hypothetical protein